MQAVMAFTKKAGTAAMSGAGSAVGGAPSGRQLGGLSRGVSLLSSITEFAEGRQRASALDQEARNEMLQSRQEYVVAEERVNAIDADFARLVGEQMAVSGAYGIDVASGSVVAAREAARDEADGERRRLRQGADTNAKLRRSRSILLRGQAKTARVQGALKLGLDVASAFMPG